MMARTRFAAPTSVGIAIVGIGLAIEPAIASVPTIDALQLTRHTETSSATVQLVPVTTQRRQANDGVKCAVTTGKPAPVRDPTVRSQPGAGARAVAPYAPDQPAVPDPASKGGALARQALIGSAGDVVAGLDASQATLGGAEQGFRQAAEAVGRAPTIMGAFDMNSGARLQNNLAWNAAIGSANLWVTAVNAGNLSAASDASRLAAAMRMTGGPSVPLALPFSPSQ